MWVRAAVAALAVWCASDVVIAAGYREVWNPPETAGHRTKPAARNAANHAQQARSGRKDAALHTASSPRRAAHGAHPAHAAHIARGIPVAHAASLQTSGHDHGGKAAAHGGVNKVPAGGTPTHGRTKGPTAGKPRTKPALIVHSGRGRWELAGAARAEHGGVSTEVHRSRPQTMQVAAKSAGSNATETLVSASGGAGGGAGAGAAGMVRAGNDPATARSGALPPIIH